MHPAPVEVEGAGRAFSSTLLVRLWSSLQVGKAAAAAPTGSTGIRTIIVSILMHGLEAGAAEAERLNPPTCSILLGSIELEWAALEVEVQLSPEVQVVLAGARTAGLATLAGRAADSVASGVAAVAATSSGTITPPPASPP